MQFFADNVPFWKSFPPEPKKKFPKTDNLQITMGDSSCPIVTSVLATSDLSFLQNKRILKGG